MSLWTWRFLRQCSKENNSVCDSCSSFFNQLCGTKTPAAASCWFMTFLLSCRHIHIHTHTHTRTRLFVFNHLNLTQHWHYFCLWGGLLWANKTESHRVWSTVSHTLWNHRRPQAFNRATSHLPRPGAERGNTSNLLGHTHSTTKCLLPRFRKVVALSTIPDGKENEWRRKLKMLTWMQLENMRWMRRTERI